ncbi:BnaCnng62930D [Brassica napus]|uniref:BnaCnng62930D protein n=1 Tax=Brassica napus TaxID=3708 RepID=A0A078JR85_BRANA|nr:BnaCnng62930D [Brassica napus]
MSILEERKTNGNIFLVDRRGSI